MVLAPDSSNDTWSFAGRLGRFLDAKCVPRGGFDQHFVRLLHVVLARGRRQVLRDLLGTALEAVGRRGVLALAAQPGDVVQRSGRERFRPGPVPLAKAVRRCGRPLRVDDARS